MAGTIRTPDQRLRVFVSSTLGELADERAAVKKAIEASRLAPVMFELGARPHPPRDLYRSYLEQSDIFVGIYWQRYGWVAPDMEISGLEDELVLSAGMPRLLYLKSPAPDREPRLAEMLGRLESEGSVSYRHFRTPRELGTLVRDDLAILLSERFDATGATDVHTRSGSPGSGPHVGRGTDRRVPPSAARSVPVATTSLVGRQRDVEDVVKQLEEPDVRLLTLTGPGGIGKTRLAMAVAERVEAASTALVAFVPLESIRQEELVLSHVVTGVGASMDGARPALDVLAEHLAGTPTLLVLDNLEQVAGVAPQLDQLLARCPDLTILATSRVALQLRSEHEHPVAPLAAAPAAAELSPPSVDDVAALPAVQLFVERARSVRPDFALTPANAPSVAEICRRLDGLPLAIELAAARTRLLDPAALLARLEHGLGALGTGPVDLPDRQRTLRATVEWSVGLLDHAERELLAALSVFVDGWTIDAAAQVAALDEDRTLDLLESLASQSLVHAVSTPTGPRFRMLETVRDYAGELLASGPAQAEVERRHAERFRALVLASDWAGHGIEQAGWDDGLRAEEGNLRAAIRWYFVHDVTPLPHVFRVLWLYWQLRDQVVEGRALVDELLARTAELDGHARLELMVASGVTAIEIGDDDKAVAADEQIEQLMGGVDDRFLLGVAELIRSWVLPIRDDLPGARQAAAASLELLRGQDEPFMVASALMTVGMLEAVAGDHAAARRHLDELGGLAVSAGFAWFTSGQQVQLALLAIDDGQVDEAGARLAAAMEVDPAALATQVLTFGLIAVARLALAAGDAALAARALGASQGLRDRAGLRVWPSQRRGEDELLDEVRRQLDLPAFQEAFTTGSQITRPEAIALVRSAASSSGSG